MTEFRRSVLVLSGAALIAAAVPAGARATVPEPEPPPSAPVATTAPAPSLPPTAPPPATTTTEPSAPTAETPTAETPTAEMPTTPQPSAPPAMVGFTSEAECNASTARTTIRWHVTNRGPAPVSITAFSQPASLSRTTVPPDSTANAERTIDGPHSDQIVTSTVTIDLGGGVTTQLVDEITAYGCEGPPLPAVLGTFTVTPSVSTASVGDTITYRYCGTNNGDVPLEVVRVTDDHLGITLEPGAVVAPGETLCNTDIGAPVSYMVQPEDVGSLTNEAILTVRTQEASPREFQTGAATTVAITPAAETPFDGGLPTTTVVPPGAQSIRICHRHSSHSNPYGETTPSTSGDLNGHANHTGPIWYDGIKVEWGDIIPPFVRPDGTEFPGLNWTIGGQAIWANGCVPTLASPAAPGVSPAACIGGVITEPTITTVATVGVFYTFEPIGPDAGTTATVVTVTAHLVDGFRWGAMPPGWTKLNSTTATYTVALTAASCVQAVPIDPDVQQATCAGGVVTPPSLTLPVTAGVTYSAEPPGPYDGTVDLTVTVTALLDHGFAWPDVLPGGWSRVDAVTASFTVDLVGSTCDEITPVAPAVAQAVCVGGTLSAPTLTLPETDGIDYQVDGEPSAGATVTVTATLTAAESGWPAQMPTGWEVTSPTTATLTLTFDDVSCAEAAPSDPLVVQAACTNGSVTAPIVLPAAHAAITYTVEPAGPFDGTVDTTVTVTATLADGFAWTDPLPDGWTRVDDVTATLTVELAGTSCDEISPVAPTVAQAVCTGGALTEPTLELPDTDGLTYAVNAQPPFAPGQTVIVTATLAGIGVGWTANLPDGWTRSSPTTATYTTVFAVVACVPATPLDPVVSHATCANGQVSAPTITPTESSGISFTADPEGPHEGTVDTSVTVTATLADGFAWTDPLPDGWTRVDGSTATFTVGLTGTTCDEVSPVAPTVSQAACIAGALTEPTLALPDTDGIDYSVDADPPHAPGQTVIVTATLVDTGVGWPADLPGGWTATTPTTATYTVVFDDVTCNPVEPTHPVVTHATCVGGVVVAPTVVPVATAGISFTVDPDGPHDGTADTTITVTATLADGFAWTDPLPDGWTRVDAVTAVSTIELAGTTCDEIMPVAPTVTEAACIAGTVTEPVLDLPDTDHITYRVDTDPPFAPGQVVIVTATLADTDVGWATDLPDGWMITSPTTAAYAVTFADATCTAVTPVDPIVMPGGCIDGESVAAELRLPATAGVSYSAEPTGPYDPATDTAVTVTATLADGFAWDGSGVASGAPSGARQAAPPPVELPAGWTWVSPTAATFAVVVPAAPPCPGPAPTTAPSPTTTSVVAVEPEPGPEIAPEADTQPEPDVQPDLEVGPDADGETEIEVESEAEIEADAEAGTSGPPAPVATGAATSTTVVASVAPSATPAGDGDIPGTGASGIAMQVLISTVIAGAGLSLLLLTRRRRPTR